MVQKQNIYVSNVSYDRRFDSYQRKEHRRFAEEDFDSQKATCYVCYKEAECSVEHPDGSFKPVCIKHKHIIEAKKQKAIKPSELVASQYH